MREISAIFALFLLAAACGGTSNVADCETGKKQVPCSARSKEEDARLALNRQPPDYDTAITLLNELAADEPDNFTRHPLLAAAYAGRSGLNILDLAKAQFGSGGSLIDQMGSFVPRPEPDDTRLFKDRLTDMKGAVDVLHAIPAELLASTDASGYANSATLQSTLYSASYSVMYLNQFTTNAATGKTDLTQLQNMSEDDALTIISTLTSAADIPGLEGNKVLQDKVNKALADINDQDGATQKEKLQAFVEKEKAGGATTTTDPSAPAPTP